MPSEERWLEQRSASESGAALAQTYLCTAIIQLCIG